MNIYDNNVNSFYNIQIAPYYRNLRLDPVLMTDEIYKNFLEIPDRYLVSNYGRIYSKINKCHLNPTISSSGYEFVGCESSNRIHKRYAIHRMVMMTFCPIENYENFQVNHKDGNKRNNHWDPNPSISNLEWCTPSENIQHAISTGLIPIGEDHYKAKHTNQQITEICVILHNNPKMPLRQLAELINHPYDSHFIDLITSLRNHSAWKNITSNYNLYPTITKTSREDIEKICELISLNYNYDDIAHIMNIPEEKIATFKSRCSSLRSGKIYKDIALKYDIIKGEL